MPAQRRNNIFVANSLFIFLSRFFPSLANLLVIVWYSKQLPPEVYGTYQFFWIQLYVMYPLICFGIHSLVVTYSRGMLANILSSIKKKHYSLFVLWMVVISVVFAFMQYESGSVSFVTSFLFILTFAACIITESLLVVFRKYIVLCTTSLLYALLFAGVHWYMLYANFSVQAIFSFLLVVNMMRLFVYSIAILSEVGKDANGYENEDINMSEVRSLWLHLGVYDVSQMLFSWIDKFVISLVLSAGMSAIYYNGAQNIPFLPLLLGAAGQAVLLQLADSKSGSEKTQTIALVNQMGRMLSCLVFPAFCFLFLFRNEIVVNLLGEKYVSSIPIFAISVLVLPVRAYSFTTILQRRHKGKIINAGALADLLLACALMYPFYLWLGLPGVALSFVVTTYLQAAFYLIYTARLLQVKPMVLLPLGNWIIKLIAFFAVFITIHYIGTIYFTGQFTLILGAIATVVTAAAALGVEYWLYKNYGSGSKTKIKEYR